MGFCCRGEASAKCVDHLVADGTHEEQYALALGVTSFHPLSSLTSGSQTESE